MNWTHSNVWMGLVSGLYALKTHYNKGTNPLSVSQLYQDYLKPNLYKIILSCMGYPYYTELFIRISEISHYFPLGSAHRLPALGICWTDKWCTHEARSCCINRKTMWIVICQNTLTKWSIGQNIEYGKKENAQKVLLKIIRV